MTARRRGRRWIVAVALLGALAIAHDQAAARSDPGAELSKTEMNLDAAVHLALQHNPALAAARAEVDAAASTRAQAEASVWPDVRVTAGIVANRRPQRLFPAAAPGEPAITSHLLMAGDLVFSVPIYTGGALSGRIAEAGARERAARAVSRWSRSQLVYEVTVSYFDVLAQRRVLDAIDAAAQALREQVATLSALVTEHKAAPLERQRLEVRVTALAQRRVEEESRMAVAELRLAALLGRGPDEPPLHVTGTLQAPAAPLPVTAAERDAAIGQRPDVQALRALAQAQAERVTVAGSGGSPRVAVQASYGLRWGVVPADAPAGATVVPDVGQVGLTVDVPIFDGGRVSAEVDAERARLRALNERVRQLEFQVGTEIAAADLTLRAALERVTLGEATVAMAREALRVESDKQAAGRATASEVLSAQADSVDAETQLAQALADANVAAAARELALGGAP